jgi:hypothetical protein
MTTEQPRSWHRHAVKGAGVQPKLLQACLGLSLGAMLFGCAAGTPRLASDIAAEVPAELRSDYLAFTTNCNKCHDLDRPLRAQIEDVRHWDAYVAKMMRTAGSAISKRESPKILRFLYWYTERKQRLESERAKEVRRPAPDKAPEPAPVPPPPPAAPAASAASSESNAVSPAPTVNAPSQVNQGEGAP